eukprot:scaffold1954_cov268-Pinguiococcus_pyrenoidosus.AAC.92
MKETASNCTDDGGMELTARRWRTLGRTLVRVPIRGRLDTNEKSKRWKLGMSSDVTLPKVATSRNGIRRSQAGVAHLRSIRRRHRMIPPPRLHASMPPAISATP